MTRISPILIVGAFCAAAVATPALAALGETSTYTAQEDADLVSVAFDETTNSLCVPPDPQYIPSFIRAPNGTIIGVSYMIIEYEC